MIYGYHWEVVHEKSGEVVNSGFVRQDPPKAGKDSVDGFIIRVTPLSLASDSERLDWSISHNEADLDKCDKGFRVVFWDSRMNPSCKVVALGITPRDAIDSAIAGRVVAIK